MTTLTADGQSSTLDWYPGEGTLTAQDTAAGTFGTLTLQFSLDGGTTWSTVGSDTTLTASGGGLFQLGTCKLRVDLSGSTSVNTLVQIERTERPR